MKHNSKTNSKNSLCAEQIEWIAESALHHLPKSGNIFISKGHISYQFALNIPYDCQLNIYTNSAKIASYLSSKTRAKVNLNDRKVVSLSVSFIDITGLNTVSNIANDETRIIKNSNKCVGLCDSSILTKIFNSSDVPITSFNCMITDKNADTDIVMEIVAHGVEVVIAGPRDNCIHESFDPTC